MNITGRWHILLLLLNTNEYCKLPTKNYIQEEKRLHIAAKPISHYQA